MCSQQKRVFERLLAFAAIFLMLQNSQRNVIAAGLAVIFCSALVLALFFQLFKCAVLLQGQSLFLLKHSTSQS